MKHGQVKKSESKRIVVFVVLLVGVLAIAGFFVMQMGSHSSAATYLPAVGADGVQEVHMKVNGLSYEPSTLTVAKDQKVRWIIDATNAQGCANGMISPKLGVKQSLKSGENIIEFTPKEAGTIKFSCPMGMASGQFVVV